MKTSKDLHIHSRLNRNSILEARLLKKPPFINAAMSDSIYAPRSDKKFGENDSVANCQPTNLQISPIR